MDISRLRKRPAEADEATCARAADEIDIAGCATMTYSSEDPAFPVEHLLDGRSAEHGFTGEAAAFAEAWPRGDQQAAERAVSNDLIGATCIAGTPEQCRERVEAYRQSGIDVPILSPFTRGHDAKASFEAVIRARAPSIRTGGRLNQ